MTFLRILGVLLIIAGGILYMTSNYIATQVGEGQAQVDSGQQKVDSMNSLFSLNPYSKQIGEAVITNPAQQRINAGQLEIAKYSAMIGPLRIGGIIAFVLGVLLLIFGGKKRII